MGLVPSSFVITISWSPNESPVFVKNVTLYIVLPVCGARYEPMTWPSIAYDVRGVPAVELTSTVPMT